MQELNQIWLKDAIGKKITAVEVGHDKHAIKFDDGSFSFFERWEEWGSPRQGNTKITYEEFFKKLNVQKNGDVIFTETQEMLINLGAMDGKKLLEDAKGIIQDKVDNIERQERKMYEILKSKFE